jgi:two-component system OmpR family response regulator
MNAAKALARLLVVDDEATILELLSGSLRLAGFEVVTAASGAEAVRAVALSRPDLVLLDVMMPDGDGFEALRRIRSGGCEVPVIFLTARDEVPDRVKGFDVGGDYVTKPFSLDELLGRIRAVLKRTRPDASGSQLRVADLELDEDAHEVRRDGAIVALTPTEYRLLRFLMVNAGRVVSKAEILDQVWGHDDPDRDGNMLEPCLSYLRRKIDQGQPRLIHTVRGFGYVLRIPPP